MRRSPFERGGRQRRRLSDVDVFAELRALISNLHGLIPIERALRSADSPTDRAARLVVIVQISRDLSQLAVVLNRDDFVRAPAGTRAPVYALLDDLLPVVARFLAELGIEQLGKDEPS